MSETTFYRIYNLQNPITICGRIGEDRMYIGVARCGNVDNYNEELGKEIALRRTAIQPYTTIELQNMGAAGRTREKQFGLIAESISNHIISTKQWQPNLKRL